MPDSVYRQLPEHVTMPLLELVTRQSLEQDYTQAAERRGSVAPEPAGARGGTAVLLAVLALFGLLVATAAVQESRSAPVDATNRAQLINQIDARREALASVQDRIGDQRARIATLDRSAADLTTDLEAAEARLLRLQARTGYGAVRGPGLRYEVDDSTSGVPEEKVRDSDLTDLVNALWSIGAEAIAINGERLTVLSGIRNVGVAIMVNGRPVSPPYVVQAIGDARTMQADLAESPRGQHFLALARALGFRTSLSNESSMLLPAVAPPILRAVDLEAAASPDVDNGDTSSSKGDQQ